MVCGFFFFLSNHLPSVFATKLILSNFGLLLVLFVFCLVLLMF